MYKTTASLHTQVYSCATSRNTVNLLAWETHCFWKLKMHSMISMDMQGQPRVICSLNTTYKSQHFPANCSPVVYVKNFRYKKYNTCLIQTKGLNSAETGQNVKIKISFSRGGFLSPDYRVNLGNGGVWHMVKAGGTNHCTCPLFLATISYTRSSVYRFIPVIAFFTVFWSTPELVVARLRMVAHFQIELLIQPHHSYKVATPVLDTFKTFQKRWF